MNPMRLMLPAWPRCFARSWLGQAEGGRALWRWGPPVIPQFPSASTAAMDGDVSSHCGRLGGRMRLLVTGCAGFIGTGLVRREARARHEVLTVDKLTYAGRLEALAEAMVAPRHRFLRADIAQRQEMESAFDDFDPDVVLHLAAESHVDRSIDDPEIFEIGRASCRERV